MTVDRVKMVEEGRRIGSREVAVSTAATRVDTPVVSKNLFFHFCDEVTLGTRVLPLSSCSSPAVPVDPDLFLGLDVRGGPLQVDQGVAGFVVLKQHVDVGGGKRTLVTQVGDALCDNRMGRVRGVKGGTRNHTWVTSGIGRGHAG